MVLRQLLKTYLFDTIFSPYTINGFNKNNLELVLDDTTTKIINSCCDTTYIYDQGIVSVCNIKEIDNMNKTSINKKSKKIHYHNYFLLVRRMKTLI